jgi:hypothetical protein
MNSQNYMPAALIALVVIQLILLILAALILAALMVQCNIAITLKIL